MSNRVLRRLALVVSLLLVLIVLNAADAQENVAFEETDCPFPLVEGMTAHCGYVTVPEDHFDPANINTLRLAVAIFGDNPDTDPVMLLAGDPGEKVVAAASGVHSIFAPIASERDFIVFDQRGVGLSEPALKCPEYVRTLFDISTMQASSEALQAQYEPLVACGERLDAEGINLNAFNTTQNAAERKHYAK